PAGPGQILRSRGRPRIAGIARAELLAPTGEAKAADPLPHRQAESSTNPVVPESRRIADFLPGCRLPLWLARRARRAGRFPSTSQIFPGIDRKWMPGVGRAFFPVHQGPLNLW